MTSVLPRQQHETHQIFDLSQLRTAKRFGEELGTYYELLVRFFNRTIIGCHIVGCPSRETRNFANYPSATHLFTTFPRNSETFLSESAKRHPSIRMWAKMAGMAVILLSHKQSILFKAIENSFLRFLDKYSYGTYVVQLPPVTLLPLKSVVLYIR